MFKQLYNVLTITTLTVLGSGIASANDITVGGKDFTEQLILTEMTGQLLEANGYSVDTRDGMGSTILRRAQVNGQVDVYWEYTGTSLIVYNEKSQGDMAPRETFEKVKKLDREKGIEWLEPSEANNTYALAVAKDNDKTADIHTISDLAAAYRAGRDITLTHDAEFSQREDGLPGLTDAYDFSVGREHRDPMVVGLAYDALNQGKVDVAVVFATDGRIAAFDLRVLEDDRNFFPDYALAPVVRASVLEDNPDLRELLGSLSSRLDDETMQELNMRVDVEKEDIPDVARTFLKDQGLL